MKKIINLTGHDICLFDKDDNYIETIKSSKCVRCEEIKHLVDTINSYNVYATKYVIDEDIPKCNDTYYVVSKIVAEALPDRDDLIIPFEMVKDTCGKIIGCKSFSVLVHEGGSI